MRILIFIFSFFFTSLIFAQNIKILTYNIHHANPPSREKGVTDLAAVAKVIKDADADVVAIQEVDIFLKRSGMIDQADSLSQLTGMDYYFSRSINIEEGFYGTLLLTKHKIVSKRKYNLPMPVKSENRTLAILDIELPNGEMISVANTHLDLKEENRIAQVHYINDMVDLYSRPFFLVGDLNAKPDSKAIQLLDDYFTRYKQAKPTFPNIHPKEVIDYILVNKETKFEWVKYEVLPEKYPSDHLPVLAEVKLK